MPHLGAVVEMAVAVVIIVDVAVALTTRVAMAPT
jgi:hypothetical protein